VNWRQGQDSSWQTLERMRSLLVVLEGVGGGVLRELWKEGTYIVRNWE